MANWSVKNVHEVNLTYLDVTDGAKALQGFFQVQQRCVPAHQVGYSLAKGNGERGVSPAADAASEHARHVLSLELGSVEPRCPVS